MVSKFISTLILIIAVGAFAFNARQPSSAIASSSGVSHQAIISWEPLFLSNGSAFIFVVRQPASLKSLQGTWLEHTVYFDWDKARKAWVGLAGVGVETPPGTY